MKAFKSFYLSLIIVSALLYVSCDKATEATGDAMALAALKNVAFNYDSFVYELKLPEGALEGEGTFNEKYAKNKELYSDETQYKIILSSIFKADNTKSSASDAKFDGFTNSIVFNELAGSPVLAKANAFTIEKGNVIDVPVDGIMSLDTHKLPMLYIFRQIVDGKDLATAFSLDVLYSIADKDGKLPLPQIKQNIPTRASTDGMKTFLSGLLESGIFDEQ